MPRSTSERPSSTCKRHIGAGTGLADATSAPGDWAHRRHIGAGTMLRVAFLASCAYAGFSYLSVSRNHSVAIYTTSIDASGPSCPPSTTYIAATTAPPPPSNSTVTGVLRNFSGCPSEPSERSGILSSHVAVRRRWAFGPGTNSQTGRQRRTSRILLSFSPVQRAQRSTETQIAESFHLP